ncbi:ABC transporter permease [uncultured Sphaerochaeta sp.]|uniref:ABC transporter permease n=1 Tax=uncultured Sphaerochaeta sp. TaxID=886478 RepID=UPI002A0A87EA|nr:ABC transporter permease [uncultured Sphaerochaeta sp.]
MIVAISKKKLKSTTNYFYASQWTLMGQKFRKHKLAVFSGILLIIFYTCTLLSSFIAPQGTEHYDSNYANCGPMKVHYFHERKFKGPFVYGLKRVRDPETFMNIFTEDKDNIYIIKFFAHGRTNDEYKWFGLINSNLHLFEAEGDGVVFLLGTDSMGRDLFSRILLGAQISLFIPVVGMILTVFLGLLIGSIAGYFGGWIDNVIQRLIEVIRSFPNVPLWMALSAALPPTLKPAQVFMLMTVILSLISWPDLARTVRSKFLSVKKEDFIMAARISGAPAKSIITRHMIPSFLSYIIINMTLSIPSLIVGETTLSFLGLGLRSPATSWGVLLQETNKLETIMFYPWKLIPMIFVFLAVLSFNFLGDGLRDAADPYK